MDQNVTLRDPVSFYASLALVRMLNDDVEYAEKWLRKLPRNQRGRLNKALDDMGMSLSRLGP